MQPRDLTKYPLQVGEYFKAPDIFEGERMITGFSESKMYAWFKNSDGYHSIHIATIIPVHPFPPMPENWSVEHTIENEDELCQYYKDERVLLFPFINSDGSATEAPKYSIISFEMWHYWMVEQMGERDYLKDNPQHQHYPPTMSNNKQSLKWEDLQEQMKNDPLVKFAIECENSTQLNVFVSITGMKGLMPMPNGIKLSSKNCIMLDTPIMGSKESMVSSGYTVINCADFIRYNTNIQTNSVEIECINLLRELKERHSLEPGARLAIDNILSRVSASDFKEANKEQECKHDNPMHPVINRICNNCDLLVSSAPQQPTDRDMAIWIGARLAYIKRPAPVLGEHEINENTPVNFKDFIASLPTLPVEEHRGFTEEDLRMAFFAGREIKDGNKVNSETLAKDLKPSWSWNSYYNSLPKQVSPGIDGWLPMETAPKEYTPTNVTNSINLMTSDGLVSIDCVWRPQIGAIDDEYYYWIDGDDNIVENPICWRFTASDRAREHYSQKK